MKRFLQFICLLTVAALLPAALLVSRGLPADAHPYIEKKYAGWNGVLRAWVCARWSCGGGFTRWLNACAAEFERQHDGVYLEFTPVDEIALETLDDSGIRPPELVLFSPGVAIDATKLAPAEEPDALRSELAGLGEKVAYPVAMGGYIWVYNRTLATGAPRAGEALHSLPDDGARSFSAAGVALLSGADGEDASDEPISDPGLDLGLPAGANVEAAAGMKVSEDALEDFLAGDLPALIVTQAELARLIRLRDAGRGPDWECAAPGQFAYTDQLLLLSFPAQAGDDAQARLALAEEFGASLLAPEAQAKLADIGAFAVTGARIHNGLSAYAALDALLNGRALLTPADVWASLPDCAEELRGISSGALDPAEALARLRARLN